MKIIRLTFLFGAIAVLFLECRTAKKIERFANVYRLSEMPKTNKVDNFTVSFVPNDSLPGLNEEANTFKNKDYLVILPFIGFYKRDYDCVLGANVFEYNIEENIEKSILNVMDSIYSNQLQNEYELKINISELLFKFKYFHKGGIFAPLIMYFTWNEEECRNTELYLKLDYELLKNGEKITDGKIERKKNIESLTNYQELPNFYNTDPNLSYRQNYSNHMNDVAYSNLNGGIYLLIMEELKVGLGAYNDNIIELSQELVTKKLAGQFE